jgi:hypothetical protein
LLGGFSFDVGVWFTSMTVTASFLDVEIREMLPSDTDPSGLTPGRTIQLTFAGGGKAIKSLVPVTASGSSGWEPITLTNARILEDFIGKGQVITGGGQFLAVGLSGADLQFLHTGGRCFVSASGFDASVPTASWGYWKQHGAIQPRPPGAKDTATLKYRLNEQRQKYGGIAIFARQWTYNAYKYTAGDLRTERAQILSKGVPGPADAARLAEIELSLDSLEQLMALMRDANW